MLDRRAIFGILRIQEPPTDPTDRQKEGREIDSFKGNLSNTNAEFRQYSNQNRPFSRRCVWVQKWEPFHVRVGNVYPPVGHSPHHQSYQN